MQRLDLEIVESAPERSESAHRRRLQTRTASGVLACSQTAGRGELRGEGLDMSECHGLFAPRKCGCVEDITSHIQSRGASRSRAGRRSP